MDAVTHVEVDRKFGILKTNGDLSVTFGPAVLAGTSYFIKINHRNSVETWSALPLPFNTLTNYDFTTGASQAFGSNMIETHDNNGWAIYNGDIDQSGDVAGADFLPLDVDIQNGNGGYINTDLNGDGATDGNDFLVLDQNIQNGVGSAIP